MRLKLPQFRPGMTAEEWILVARRALETWAVEVENASAINGPGSANTLTDYLYLPGRTGGQVANGGAATGENLEFHSNPTDDGVIVFDASNRIRINRNAIGITRMLLGSDIDPTEPIAPGGLMQFVVSSDVTAEGLQAIMALWTMNGGPGQGSAFYGVSGNGTRQAPTASGDFDNFIGMIGVGYDENDQIAFNPPSGSIVIGRDQGPASGGIVPGIAGISTLSRQGTDSCHLWVLEDGRVLVTNDFNVGVAKLHVRTGGFVGQGAQFNDAEPTAMLEAHDGQTKDLCQFGQEINMTVVTGGGDLAPGAASVFLNDTTGLPNTGTIYMRYQGKPVPNLAYEAFEFTANNTGTGELTLASVTTGTITESDVVFYIGVIAQFDVLGAWHPPHLADANAQNDSVYFSTDATKLVYKDSGGTVNNLY